MSKAIDYDLKTSAHEVQRLMGQCILRLQVYELLLKCKRCVKPIGLSG